MSTFLYFTFFYIGLQGEYGKKHNFTAGLDLR